MSFTQIFFSLLCLSLFVVFWLQHTIGQRRVHHTSVASIRQLLDPPETIGVLLRARASPNQRLVKAFALSNTFVSDDAVLHKQFRGKAERLIASANDWHRFNRVTAHAVAHFRPAPGQPYPLDIFVQIVTMQVIVVGLLFVDSPEDTYLRSENVTAVSVLITELWATSKHPSSSFDPQKLQTLNDHLREMTKALPGASSVAREFPNLLDILIPSWETLWRVIAAALGHVWDDKTCRAVLSSFNASSLSVDAFRIRAVEDISVEGIILETMRLHPPSKNISRTLSILPPFASSYLPRSAAAFFERTHAASVLSVQMSPSIWGPTAHEFDAARRRHAPAFVAFGHGRLGCIAKNWAPMAAGVVLANIMESVDVKVAPDAQIGGRDGWDGWEVVSPGH